MGKATTTANRRYTTAPRRGEVLVAIVPNLSDWSILREQLWYRIPVQRTPRRWPPRWLAFYQPKVFRGDAYAVRWYGQVNRIERVRRPSLFPNEPPNQKSEREYFKVSLKSLEMLPKPIPSMRLRRVVFISTTWRKLISAEEINDLWDDSPLEDMVRRVLKRMKWEAERQFPLGYGGKTYLLDFALHCASGKLDIETDGDTWHADPARIREDNRRNNALASCGWQVLRFNTMQVREEMAEYCIPQMVATVSKLGGIANAGMVHQAADGAISRQLGLFESA